MIAGVALLSACSGLSDQTDQSDWAQEWIALPHDYEDLPPMKVAIVDGGLLPVPSLDGRVVGAWEAPSLTGQTRNEHATLVASLLFGFNSLAPEKPVPTLEILDVRVVGPDGKGTASELAEGISWAAQQNPQLIVVSLSHPTEDDALRSAIQEAQTAGALVIASTANGFLETPAYPAEYDGVVGVTSVRENMTLAPQASSRGADVAAPGHDLLVASTDDPIRVSGTSYATAIVAGIIAGCPHPRPTGEIEVVQWAKASGVTVAHDNRSTPVLRCIPGRQ